MVLCFPEMPPEMGQLECHRENTGNKSLVPYWESGYLKTTCYGPFFLHGKGGCKVVNLAKSLQGLRFGLWQWEAELNIDTTYVSATWKVPELPMEP